MKCLEEVTFKGVVYPVNSFMLEYEPLNKKNKASKTILSDEDIFYLVLDVSNNKLILSEEFLRKAQIASSLQAQTSIKHGLLKTYVDVFGFNSVSAIQYLQRQKDKIKILKVTSLKGNIFTAVSSVPEVIFDENNLNLNKLPKIDEIEK